MLLVVVAIVVDIVVGAPQCAIRESFPTPDNLVVKCLSTITEKYDVIVNGRDKKDKVKRISTAVGKKLLTEVMCDYAY